LAERLHSDEPADEAPAVRSTARQHESKRDNLAAMPTVVPLHRET
jgi:hypothetical protein